MLVTGGYQAGGSPTADADCARSDGPHSARSASGGNAFGKDPLEIPPALHKLAPHPVPERFLMLGAPAYSGARRQALVMAQRPLPLPRLPFVLG